MHITGLIVIALAAYGAYCIIIKPKFRKMASDLAKKIGEHIDTKGGGE